MVSRRLAAIVAGVTLGTAPLAASFASEEGAGGTATPPRLRIAVALEGVQRLSFPTEFGERAGERALAQGVREACLPSGPESQTRPAAPCSEIGDAPGSRVCVDETLARALSREIECGTADCSAEPIELSGAACQTAGCFRGEAEKAGASHLLLVTAGWHDGLAVTATLTSLRGGQDESVGPAPGYNPQRPRTGPQVLAILKWVARDAALGELRRAHAAGLARAAVTTVPVVAPTVVAPPLLAAPERSSHTTLAWTLIGAGVAAGAASGWLFSTDKADTECATIAGDPEPCSKVRRTLVPAVGLGIGAAAALVSGVVLLFRDGGTATTTVSLYANPTGLSLGGRF
jgi:hypothetical protein